MRDIKNIVIHCADTPTGKDFDAKNIDHWHIERGFHRSDVAREKFNPHLFAIGYHFVIRIDGLIETGRSVEEIGAHVSGMNSTSIGICMIGEGKYTDAQWEALKDLVTRLKLTYPKAKVIGHYQTPTGQAQGKDCPKFKVDVWAAANYTPNPVNIS